MINSIRNCIEGFEREILTMEQAKGQGIRDVLNTMGLSHVKLPSSQVIALMDMLTDGITPVSPDIVTAMLTICEGYKKLLFAMAGLLEEGVMNAPAPVDTPPRQETAPQEPDRDDSTSSDASEDDKQAPASSGTKAPTPPNDESEHAQQQTNQAIKASSISSIRVDTERLDNIIELVGKLMVTYAVISQAGGAGTQQAASSLRELDLIITNLQTEVNAVRLVPLKQIFVPMHRLVNSLAQKMGKKLSFDIQGDSLALDKTIVESLNEPLVHLLRNAVDHGLEMPEERKAAGKPAAGSVRLSASRRGENAYIEIKDDGHGLDPDRILTKAVEKGIVEPDAELEERDIFRLILESGFSTAAEVTDVSGRGVGMDAVINVIRNTLDGEIDIHSTPGHGSTFTLEIPLSRSANEGIVEALVCRLGQDQFIIPSQDVVEIYVPRPQEVVDLPDGRQTVDVRGHVHTLLRLGDYLDIETDISDMSRAQAVVVRVGELRTAILVDEVLRQQQVVITKFTLPVGEIFSLPILGYGMMGESDALVVDVEALVRSFCAEEPTA